MDDLVHHCLRELSFDGDLGSNVSRLKDFIVDFYSQPEAPHPQNPDAAFCAFVWSLVVQQPTVRVGTVPEGLTSEVWIAPQTSKAKKAKEKGEVPAEATPPELDLIPDAETRSLELLIDEFGDRLRVAVEPNAIYAAITGSHIRFAKLSPMVYSALQVITRGRDEGVSVVSLGKQTGYDQKTCFYLIKQLEDLNLVDKVRKGGVGTNFAIHRYFYERSSHWKAIREEANKAEEEDKITHQTSDEIEEEIPIEGPALDFTPIDARHLSSLPLVKSRVVKLLKASKNFIHESNNMLITIGFPNPTKTDRRFFQNRIKELIQQSVIEKVVVPSLRKKASTAMVKCFRLVTAENKPEGVVLDTLDDEEVEEQVKAGLVEEMSGVKMNSTLHKQIFNLLSEAGTRGMTLSDISTTLCNFDKRTVELLLARADKVLPPLNLSDQRIVGLMETSGRERRHRYYTITAYQALIDQENFDPSQAGIGHINLTNVGEFAGLEAEGFYRTEEALTKYQDSYKVEAAVNGKKKKPLKNPILPDGSVKLGRPRKHPVKGTDGGGALAIKAGRKRKVDASEVASVPEPASKKPRGIGEKGARPELQAPKRRGRPPKNKTAPTETAPPLSPTSASGFVAQGTSLSLAAPKKRGQPFEKRPISSEANSSHRESKRTRQSANEDVASTTLYVIPRSPLLNQPIVDANIGVDPERDDHVVGHDQEVTGSGEHAPRPQDDAILENAVSTTSLPLSHPEGSPSTQAQSTVHRRDSIPVDPTLSEQLPVSSIYASSNTGKASRGRINVSNLRRETEICRVIENLGGIVHTQSKEFTNAHLALLEKLAKAGEPTSAPPGTKTDKRTVTATLDALETRGKIKRLKTSIQVPTGVERQATIAFLAHITDAQIRKYLSNLASTLQPVPQSASFVKIDEKVEYGADPTAVSRSILPLQLLQLEQPGTDKKERWSKNLERANQLFSYDDETIREVLLAERTTLGQLYGFVVGKMARIRNLHLLLLGGFEGSQSSTNIISKEHKIFDLSFLCYDLPLEQYFSLVSCLEHDQDLWRFFSAETGKRTPVRDLPSRLHSLVQIGRSRARSRFLEMLEVLRSLEIAIPLQPSENDEPLIACNSQTRGSLKLDLAPTDNWTTSTPMVAPSLWKLNDMAPIHIWRDSETNPPFGMRLSIDTVASASHYWEELRIASSGTSIYPHGKTTTGELSASSVTVSLARSLRRPKSWNTEYFLTWHQMQYLKQFIDIHSAETPLEETDDVRKEELLNKVCRVSSATKDAVSSFFDDTRERMLRELDKIKQKEKRASGLEREARRAAEVKELLARKAAEARREREQDWDSLLLRVHPDNLSSVASSRIKRVQKRFLEAGSTQEPEKWGKEILDAVREADLARALKMANRSTLGTTMQSPPPLHPQNLPPPPIVLNPLEPSVRDLIQRQGAPLEPPVQPKKRKRRKNKDDGEHSELEHLFARPEISPTGENLPEKVPKVTRRHRFQWTRDYDELARDAAAIIRARCRSAARVDWAAFEQVFPAVPRNTVRQRLTHIREAPGNEAYMNRLEDKWYELWMQHRGTPTLPDSDPQSTSNFDLTAHIEFLRKHIDKNALRVGYSHTREKGFVIIPPTTTELFQEYEIDISEGPGLTWDFIWNANVEEGKEKALMRQAFNQTLESIPTCTEATSDSVALAEAALKMTLGAPTERYDAEQGALILNSVGQKDVETAAKSLVSRGVLSKLVRDPQRSVPGRHLKISDLNLNTVGGSIPKDTFENAIALEDTVAQDDPSWREWPLTATDGECAGLLELVMEGAVDFRIDTGQARDARVTLDWNSKKADDDQIETTVFYQRTVAADSIRSETENEEGPDEVVVDVSTDPSTEHGMTENGKLASCKLTAGSNSLVDCASCLAEAMMELKGCARQEHLKLLRGTLGAIHDSGRTAVKTSRADLVNAIQELTRTTVPLVYWTGYTSLVVVSAPFIRHWSTKISDSPPQRIFPRRWLDTKGHKIREFWEAALKTALGLVLFRPGISQAEIRWRLRSTYDRHEVHDIIRHLVTEDFLKVQMDTALDISQDATVPLDDEEGRRAFYYIGDRRWYQV